MIAKITNKSPASCVLAPYFSEIYPAATIPKMTAILVPMPITPFPQDNFSGGNNSGKLPYLAGPKKALWVLIRKITPTMKFKFP